MSVPGVRSGEVRDAAQFRVHSSGDEQLLRIAVVAHETRGPSADAVFEKETATNHIKDKTQRSE